MPRTRSPQVTAASAGRPEDVATSWLTQRAERRAQFFAKQLWFLPGGEMPAPGGLIEVGEVRITLFGPAARGPEYLAGEYGEGSRYRDRRRLLTGCLGLGLGSS